VHNVARPCPPATLPQIFKDKARVHNLPGVKMKREYKALIEQYI
jgi:hypothetical protein